MICGWNFFFRKFRWRLCTGQKSMSKYSVEHVTKPRKTGDSLSDITTNFYLIYIYLSLIRNERSYWSLRKDTQEAINCLSSEKREINKCIDCIIIQSFYISTFDLGFFSFFLLSSPSNRLLLVIYSCVCVCIHFRIVAVVIIVIGIRFVHTIYHHCGI